MYAEVFFFEIKNWEEVVAPVEEEEEVEMKKRKQILGCCSCRERSRGRRGERGCCSRGRSRGRRGG